MAKEWHKIAKDGLLEDGVSHHPATRQHLDSYRQAEDDLARFGIPILFDRNDPHSRLFVASFDGTGNDALSDHAHATNVAKLHRDFEALNDHRIRSRYLPGPGTQSDLLSRTLDGATGYTHDRRIEEMHKKFMKQSAEWLEADPEAKIAVLSVGFSRGAEQAAGFGRLVNERGLPRADDSMPTLPCETAQAALLFDPVNTGRAENRDRRLTCGHLSGLQIISSDEQRRAFKSDHIIDPGISEDGRFLGVTVAGAHSDIGGSYHRDGLASRSLNLGKDYINALSREPLLQKELAPDDPRQNVIHHSDEGLWIYRLDRKVDRNTPGGINELLVPRGERARIDDPYNAEPVDADLNAQFERQSVHIGAQTQALRDAPAHPITFSTTGCPIVDALCDAAERRDVEESRRIAMDYARSTEGRAMLEEGRELYRQQQAHEAQEAASLRQQQEPAVPRRSGPPMRH